MHTTFRDLLFGGEQKETVVMSVVVFFLRMCCIFLDLVTDVEVYIHEHTLILMNICMRVGPIIAPFIIF